MKVTPHVVLFVTLMMSILLLSYADPAMYTAIHGSGMTRMLNTILPPIFFAIKHLPFPDIDDGHHHFRNIKFHELDIGTFDAKSDPSGVLMLKINNFNLQLGLDYRYKRTGISASGTVIVTISEGVYDFHVKLENENGRLKATIAHTAIDVHKASVKITGGKIAKFIDAIKSLFHSRIKALLISGVEKGLTSALKTFAAKTIDEIPQGHALLDWGYLDLSVVGPIQYNDNRIIVGFNGEVQSLNRTPSGLERHTIPYSLTDRPFEVTLDTFVLNTAFQTYYNQKILNHICTYDNPNSFKTPLYTPEWAKKGFPQLQTVYPDHHMMLTVTLESAPVLTTPGGGAPAVLTSMLRAATYVMVENQPVHIFTLQLHYTATIAGGPSLSSFILGFQDVQMTSTQVVESTIGDIPLTSEIIQEYSSFITLVLENTVHRVFINGLPLPLSKHFKLEPVSYLLFPDNGLSTGTTIDYTL